MIIVFITMPNIIEAEKLAVSLVEEKLAACVQIYPKMTSIYFWEGKIQRDEEHLLLAKTFSERFDELEKFVRANHPYDTPEIVGIKADNVSGRYLEWLRGYTQKVD